MGLGDKTPIRRGGNLFKGKATRNAHGRESEKRVLKKLDIPTTPASGALDGAKGDGCDLKFRAECKSTIHKSLSVKYDWLCKIQKEAMETGHQPLMVISFVDATGFDRPMGDWVMMRRVDFEELRANSEICEEVEAEDNTES